MVLRSFFPIRKTQAFLLKPALFYKLSDGLSNTNQFAEYLSSLLHHSDSHLVLAILLPLPSLYLSISCTSARKYPSFFLLFCQATMGFQALISSGRGTEDDLVRRDALFHHLHYILVPLLFPLVSTLHCSRTGGVLSHSNSSTHSFVQRLWSSNPGHISSHSMQSSYGLYATRSSATRFFIYGFWSRSRGVARIRGSMFSHHAPFRGKGWVTTAGQEPQQHV